MIAVIFLLLVNEADNELFSFIFISFHIKVRIGLA